MTLSLGRGSWLLRQFDTFDDETPYRFRFLRWVQLGVRADLAAVEFVDPWRGWEGRGQRRAVLGSRHRGYDLRAMKPAALPLHVYVLTCEPSHEDATVFEPGELAIAAWATVAPTDAAPIGIVADDHSAMNSMA